MVAYLEVGARPFVEQKRDSQKEQYAFGFWRGRPVSHQPAGDGAWPGYAVMGGRLPHWVDGFIGPISIKFVFTGAGMWKTSDGLYRVDEEHFLILNDGQSYSLVFDETEPHDSFCAFFKRGFVEDVARAMTQPHGKLLDNPGSDSTALRFREHLHWVDERVIPALRRLRAQMLAPDAGVEDVEHAFRALAGALVGYLWSDLPTQVERIPAARASTRAECHRRLTRARDYIHAHMGDPLDLDLVAAQAALSPHHFHRLFVAAFGEPPHRYLLRLRLARSARLLKRTGTPISEVAGIVGFESLSAFSRQFTRHFSVSPSSYRRQHRSI